MDEHGLKGETMSKKVRYYLGGRGKYLSHFSKQVSDLNRKYIGSDSFLEQMYLLGEIDGIGFGCEESHKKAIKTLVNAKNEIKELIKDRELFLYEIRYLEGYINGVEQTLQQNRFYFSLKIPIFALGWFENLDILNLVKCVFLTAQFEECPLEDIPFINNPNGCFYFTTSLSEFIMAIKLVNEDTYDLTISFVVEDKKTDVLVEKLKTLPEIELFRLNIVRIKDECNAEKVFKKMIKNVYFEK